MQKFVIVFLFLHQLSGVTVNAQNSPTSHDYFVNGLSFNFGLGHFVVEDDFISKEKYSGNSQSYEIEWSKFHQTYGFRLLLDIVNSASIENFNISANLTEIHLNLGYLYPIGSVTLFSKKLYFLLGPTPEITLYYRSQNIARGGTAIVDAFSVATLFSLGLKTEYYYPVTKRLQVEGKIQSSFVSLGGKVFDPRDKKESFFKVLTILKAMNFRFDVSTRYRISNRLSVQGGYNLKLLRISSWDYLISASDNVYFTLSMHI